jgi:pimeloyl-ACP methyl ester carboxylesterase
VARFAVAGMSVGGPYALAAAARHPDRVAAAAAVAAPSPANEFWRAGQRDLLALTIDEAITAMRPEFEKYVAGMRPGDPDDNEIAGRYTAELHPIDADALAALPAADVAASAREALARTGGYLRDAAATFRPWDFRPQDITVPVRLWYGTHDTSTDLGNGWWLAEHIPGAGITVDTEPAHLSTLLRHWDQILPWLASKTPR